MVFMKPTSEFHNSFSPRSLHLILSTALVVLTVLYCLQGSLAKIEILELEKTERNSFWRSQIGKSVHARSILAEKFGGAVIGRSTSFYHPFAVKTNRIDPIDHFHKYKGGYDIENIHYWASTAFTGIYGYAIAAIWLLAGILLGCIASFSVNDENVHIDKRFYEPARLNLCCYALFLLIIILTASIAAGCGVVFLANRYFHSRAKRVENTIINTTENATITIYNVTSTMADMEGELGSYDQRISNYLSKTIQDLEKYAVELKRKVRDNKRNIDRAISILYKAVAVIGSVNLAFVIVGLGISYKPLCILLRITNPLFYVIISLCWILIALNWIAVGVCFAIKNFADDTCVAMKDYERIPSNTTLDSILPCADLKSANNEVSKAREELSTLIREANKNITFLHEQGESSGQSALQLIPFICDPFSGPPNYRYTGNCSSGSIPVGQIPKILKGFKCSDISSAQTCVSDGAYDTIVAYTSTAQNMINIIPELESLINCSFVVDAFSVVVKQQCRPFKGAIRLLWMSMTAVSALMSLLIILWLSRFLHDRSEMQFSSGFIMPHDTSSASSS